MLYNIQFKSHPDKKYKNHCWLGISEDSYFGTIWITLHVSQTLSLKTARIISRLFLKDVNGFNIKIAPI